MPGCPVLVAGVEHVSLADPAASRYAFNMRATFWVILSVAAGGPGLGAAPTFYKDVLPVLQRNCQGCHRPGEAAPMALLTYDDARPWAKAIRQAVLTKKMPPWLA